MSTTVAWSQKTKEMHNQHIDSTFWNDFKFRDDDIIISTYAKSGKPILDELRQWMEKMLRSLCQERYRRRHPVCTVPLARAHALRR